MSVELEATLLDEAGRLGGHPTPSDTTRAALEEYVTKRRQAQLRELFGTIDFDPEWDYKQERRR